MESDKGVPKGPRHRGVPRRPTSQRPQSSGSAHSSPTSGQSSLFPAGDIFPIQIGPDGLHRDVAASPLRIRATGPPNRAGPAASGAASESPLAPRQVTVHPSNSAPYPGHAGVRIASLGGPAKQPQLLTKASPARMERAANVPKGPKQWVSRPTRPEPSVHASSPETRRMYVFRELTLIKKAMRNLEEGLLKERQQLTSCKEAGIRGVGESVWASWQSSRPDDRWQSKREGLLARVQKAIERGWPDQGLVVTPFGSSVTGLEGAESDMDLVLLDPTRPLGAATPPHLILPSLRPVRLVRGMPDFYDVFSVSQALRRQGFEAVTPVAYAAVPIVKFRDPRTGLDLDLNINDRFGLQNSALIRAYAELRPQLLRPLIFAIKHWAKRRFLNDPAGNVGQPSMSSYALSLLVIQYLQSTGDLPNLQSPQLLQALGMPKERMWKPPRPQPPSAMARIMQARERDRRQGKHVAELVGPKAYDTTFTYLREKHDFAEYRRDSPDRLEQLEALGAALVGFFAWLRDSSDLLKICAASVVAGGFIPRTPYKSEAERKQLKRSNRQAKSQADSRREGTQATATDAGSSSTATKGSMSLEHTDAIDLTARAVESTVSSELPTDQLEHLRVDEETGSGAASELGESIQVDDFEVHKGVPAHHGPSNDPDEDVISLERYDEPESWANNPIVVQDPFIVDRNCSGSIREPTARRIEEEVERACDVLARAQQVKSGCAPHVSAALVYLDLCEDVRVADAGYYVQNIEEQDLDTIGARGGNDFVRPEMPDSLGRNGSRILSLLDAPERDELEQLLHTQSIEDELDRNARQARAQVERQERPGDREGRRSRRGGVQVRARKGKEKPNSGLAAKPTGSTQEAS